MLFVFAGALPAQQHTQISGLIRDPSGAAVPGAMVTVVSQETGFRRVTHSGSAGRYLVASVQPGHYKITVRKEGFRTLVRYGVKLDAAQPGQLDFVMPLGSVQEVLTVTAAPAPFNTEDGSIGTLVGREQIEKIPLNGRGLLSLLELAPGTVVTPAAGGEPGQFSTSGQRPNANYFLVDGVSANTGVSGGGLPAQTTGGSLPGMTALGSFHGLVSLEALNEFRVQTSTATPEFGNLPGAHILLASRSGSNEFHGSMFYYGRRGSLDARNWFANRAEAGADPLALNDFGATIGGPLKQNRAFFFASYEGMRLREPFSWRSPSPTREARESAPDWARSSLDLFPFPNGQQLTPDLAEWNGLLERNSRFDVASLRTDVAATSWLTVFARYNQSVSANEFTSTQVNDLRIRSSSATLGANLLISPRLFLEFRGNYTTSSGRSHWRSSVQPAAPGCPVVAAKWYLFRRKATCDSLYRFSIAGVGEIVSGAEGDQFQDQWQLLGTGTLSLGSHQLRIGGDHRQYSPERRDRGSTLSIIAEDYGDILRRSNLWVATAEPRNARSFLSEFSAFVQDTWRIHPRVTATFGVRWEYPRPPQVNSLDGTPYDGNLGDGIWRRSYGNLAPRVGVAIRPLAQDRLVIRGGWGVYYDSTLSIATDLVNGGPFSLTQFLSGRNAPFSTLLSYGFADDLRLPKVWQWNVTVERGFGEHDALSVAYVGSAGERLLRREFGAVADSETLWLALATNHGSADYQGLQVQYRRPMSKKFQVLTAYSWSHSIDNSSSDSLLYRIGPGLDRRQDRGSSDFDVRHALTATVTYESGRLAGRGAVVRLLSDWGVDAIFRARTGFPVTPLNSEYSSGLSFANAFRPDLVHGQPVWISDRAAPGGRRLNPEAFATAGDGVQGSLGRNAIRGFGMQQIDFAVRREFGLGEQRKLMLRLEAFNLFNHPNFADPTRYLSSPLFGESRSTLNMMLGTGSPGSGLTPTLQTGGARSLQIVLRFRF